MRSIPARPRTAVPASVAAIALAALLAACGGGGSTKSASASGTPIPSSPAGSSTDAPAGGRGFPGVFGSVAALSGSSMEVQNPSTGQTTVDWTAATTFSQTVALEASDLTPGECVTVTGTTGNGPITARSVLVSSPSASGTCAAGFGARRRAAAPDSSGTGSGGSIPPGSTPGTGGRGRSGGGFLAGGGFAAGTVVSSSATTLVVHGTSFTGTGRPPSTSTPPTTAAPTDITVTLTPSTIFTEMRAATASDLAVGDCVTAAGRRTRPAR